MASKLAMRQAVAAYSSKPTGRTISTLRCVISRESPPPSSSSSTAAVIAPYPRSTVCVARRWKFTANPETTNALTGEAAAAAPDSQTQLANVALAAALVGFSGFVFTYSMNAVGRADSSIETLGEDPLAQLKAEAQEAKEHRSIQKAQRMTPEEVAALESGMTDRQGGDVEVAVAAPAEIAELEEETNRKLFQKNNNNVEEAPKKKKPWWRFGF